MTVLFAFVAIVILLIVVLLQAWFYNWKVDLQAQRQRPVGRAANAGRDRQEPTSEDRDLRLGRSQDQKDRTIPIDVAMKLVAEDFAAPARRQGDGRQMSGMQMNRRSGRVGQVVGWDSPRLGPPYWPRPGQRWPSPHCYFAPCCYPPRQRWPRLTIPRPARRQARNRQQAGCPDTARFDLHR